MIGPPSRLPCGNSTTRARLAAQIKFNQLCNLCLVTLIGSFVDLTAGQWGLLTNQGQLTELMSTDY